MITYFGELYDCVMVDIVDLLKVINRPTQKSVNVCGSLQANAVTLHLTAMKEEP